MYYIITHRHYTPIIIHVCIYYSANPDKKYGLPIDDAHCVKYYVVSYFLRVL